MILGSLTCGEADANNLFVAKFKHTGLIVNELRPSIRDEHIIKYDELTQVRVKFSLTNVVFFDGLGYISRADECRFLSPDSFRSKATALDLMRLSPERRANWRL